MTEWLPRGWSAKGAESLSFHGDWRAVSCWLSGCWVADWLLSGCKMAEWPSGWVNWSQYRHGDWRARAGWLTGLILGTGVRALNSWPNGKLAVTRLSNCSTAAEWLRMGSVAEFRKMIFDGDWRAKVGWLAEQAEAPSAWMMDGWPDGRVAQ